MLVAVLLMILSYLFTLAVSAHSWFPHECCGNGDCKEIIEWRTEGDQWIIKTNEMTKIVPTTFPIRPSQDNKRYLCATKLSVYCIFSLSEI